jgi:uncharacterized RDD family membrane protein YckC
MDGSRAPAERAAPMKCPKCQYISFESSERCRNCGYEFSLALDSAGFDLPIQTGNEPLGPLSDFSLERLDDRKQPAASGAGASGALADFGATPQPRPITSAFDLPLFKERRRDSDAPLVAPPVAPRPPLAVRRSTPTPRGLHRPAANEPVLNLEAAIPIEHHAPSRRPEPSPAVVESSGEPDGEATIAGVGARLLASAVDALILSSIALAVLYLTLKICGLDFSAVAVIPPVPFVGFLLLIAGGYLTLFTVAGGQTIGKMAAGIRVVSTGEERLRVPLGSSVLRAAAYLASALPAGLGFLPALLDDDRRAIHDRLADTRVVKA